MLKKKAKSHLMPHSDGSMYRIKQITFVAVWPFFYITTASWHPWHCKCLKVSSRVKSLKLQSLTTNSNGGLLNCVCLWLMTSWNVDLLQHHCYQKSFMGRCACFSAFIIFIFYVCIHGFPVERLICGCTLFVYVPVWFLVCDSTAS